MKGTNWHTETVASCKSLVGVKTTQASYTHTHTHENKKKKESRYRD